jgi:hypothetical protein
MYDDDREHDARYEAAIEDGRIAVYAISMAIVIQLNGLEYEGTAEWKYVADAGGEEDFDNKAIGWFEANCELLDLDWDDEQVENELGGEALSQIEALAEEFYFDLDTAREN